MAEQSPAEGAARLYVADRIPDADELEVEKAVADYAAGFNEAVAQITADLEKYQHTYEARRIRRLFAEQE